MSSKSYLTRASGDILLVFPLVMDLMISEAGFEEPACIISLETKENYTFDMPFYVMGFGDE